MFIVETMVSAIVGYILVALFASLLFFRSNWKSGEGREDIDNSPCGIFTVEEQKYSCMSGCLLLGAVWPVSVSIYLICRSLVLLVEGMLYISDKFTNHPKQTLAERVARSYLEETLIKNKDKFDIDCDGV